MTHVKRSMGPAFLLSFVNLSYLAVFISEAANSVKWPKLFLDRKEYRARAQDGPQEMERV